MQDRNMAETRVIYPGLTSRAVSTHDLAESETAEAGDSQGQQQS